jgi:hypothetical protein
MINKARILEIRLVHLFWWISLLFSDHSNGINQVDWLCHWLYTPRDDGKAKVLILPGKYIYSQFVKDLVERIKQVLILMHMSMSMAFLNLKFSL